MRFRGVTTVFLKKLLPPKLNSNLELNIGSGDGLVAHRHHVCFAGKGPVFDPQQEPFFISQKKCSSGRKVRPRGIEPAAVRVRRSCGVVLCVAEGEACCRGSDPRTDLVGGERHRLGRGRAAREGVQRLVARRREEPNLRTVTR